MSSTMETCCIPGMIGAQHDHLIVIIIKVNRVQSSGSEKAVYAFGLLITENSV